MSSEFIFDMSAYSYSQGLRAIRLMFEAAGNSLSAQSLEVDNSIAKYQQHIDNGGAPIGEWEDGHKLWDQEGLLGLEHLAIEDALIELRVATTIAIYHLWERSIPNSRGSINRNHSRLIKDAAESEIDLHPDIDALCFAANYFKHGTHSWRTKLLGRWSDRFSSRYPKSDDDPPWMRKLYLHNDHIEWFLEIAQQSERPISNHWTIPK